MLFIHRQGGDRLGFALPYVYLTDEPHYLTGLNSVLWDGDVELSNNYARNHFGKLDSGIHRAGQVIDHHTYVRTFTDSVERHGAIFGSFNDPVDRDALGRQRPRARRIPASGVLPEEYSWHPTYPFFLLAPFLSLSPRSAVEPLILCLIAALTFAAALRFRSLCTVFVPNGLYADLAMLAVFAGTPVLFYSRGLFPEGFYVILSVFAYHACIVRQRWVGPGLCFMIAAALKPPAALLAVPVILLTAERSYLRAIAVFLMTCVGAWFSFFELRVLKGIHQSGTVVDPERLIDFSSLGYMPYSNLFNTRYGLFAFAPVLTLALIGWVPLSRRFPKEAGALLAGLALNFAFPCLIGFFGSSYAGRYLVPVIPLLGIGFAGIWFYPTLFRRVLLAAFGALLAISAAINLKGTVWWKY